jgi:hypothetical protein
MARVQHMVLLKFKPQTPQKRIDELFAMLAGLKKKLKGIEYYSGGPYSSPEGFNQGYTHGFLMTFTCAADRDAYLPHPEHEIVKQALLAEIDGAVAFDFEEN